MGQSVAEHASTLAGEPLPDLLAGGPASVPAGADGQADDLLSQLAGAEIDRMLAAADLEPASAPAPPLPPSPAVMVESVPPAIAAAPISVVAEAPAPPTPPTADLHAVLSEAATGGSAAGSEVLDLSGPPGNELPLLLRPLVLLSAPLDRFPDAVRVMVGKVAVVTLLNAVAVIVYVLIFRRHG